MKLVPQSPPGRTNRKVRAFVDEIARLRSAGYTQDSIRQGLEATGVSVSRSTVQREIARMDMQARVTGTGQPRHAPAPSEPAPMSETAVFLPPPADDGQTTTAATRPSKEAAKRYMEGYVSNPLLRNGKLS